MLDLTKIFRPSSIALIGVSRKEGSLGKNFLNAILRMHYQGKIYIINPKADQILGIKCYPDLKSLPQKPDLAIILLPYKFVLPTLEDLGKNAIRNVIVISAGFKEIGGEGVEREKQLVEIARRYGMNLLGPNCMGIFNTDPSVSFNGTFSPTLPNPGHVAYVSQSGALGVAIMELAAQTDLGFSVFVSTGNKAVISDHHVLEFLKGDPNTYIVTLYLESIDNPRAFLSATQKLGIEKPILAVKAGRTESGKKAASSHTGALANPEYIMDGFLRQCGVLRMETVEDMFDAARALAAQPLPKGKKMAVITNAGGPGILASDALEQQGLKLARFEESTVEKLRSFLPEEAACTNPVDMIASATHETYRDALEVVVNDPNVDGVILIIVKPPVNTTPAMIAEHLEPVLKNTKKTVIPVLMAQRDETAGVEIFKRLNLPIFSYPESAAKALGVMVRYQNVRKQLQTMAEKQGSERPASPALKTRSGQAGQAPLADLLNLLQAYDIPLVDFVLSPNAEDLLGFMRGKSGKFVLKIANEQILHKTEHGLVRLNITSKEELLTTIKQLQEKAQALLPPEVQPVFLIQQQLASGLELVLGGKRDDHFGPFVMFGIGGIFVEALKDIRFRLAPFGESVARQMIDELKAQVLLNGFRGMPKADRGQLSRIIANFSRLLADHNEIAEMDLNPLIVTLDGIFAVDVRATVEPAN
jgi:acetyltransferase